MANGRETDRSSSNQKRYNHEVSKCLLASWVDRSGAHAGHHYFDIQAQRSIFEVGRNAKFAATEYLYMPAVDDGERSQALEDWLSIDEAGLGLLCKAAAKSNPDLMPDDQRLVTRAVRSCVSLGVRSAYHFYLIAQIPGLADLMKTGSSHQALAKNVFLAVQRSFSNFMNWDFQIIYDLSVPLLVNEQPFRDWSLREGTEERVSMPLAPTALLTGSPPKDRNRAFMTLAWYPAPGRPHVSEMHNEFIVKTARQWVLGSNAAQVNEVGPQLSAALVRERMAKVRFVLL